MSRADEESASLRCCTLCERSAPARSELLDCERCNMLFCCESHKRLHCDDDGGGECFPIDIKTRPEVGRYIAAARDIREGEVIFTDLPLVVGPNQESAPICLVCFSPISGGSCHYCNHCRYPFCSEDCARDQRHEPECLILREDSSTDFGEDLSSAQMYNYHLVVPLRLLLLAEMDEDAFAMTRLLMDHNDERRKEESYWKECQEKIVSRLLTSCGQSPDRFAESSVHRAVGVLEVNAYELHSTVSGAGHRGIFPLGALLSHCCVANATASYDRAAPFRATYVACMDIAKGDEICSRYLMSTMSTSSRRLALKDGWHFDCCCLRCSDPTELDTYLGAVRCKKCRPQGASLRADENAGYFLLKNPLEKESPWLCNKCSDERKDKDVQEEVSSVLGKVKDLAAIERYNLEGFLSLRREAAQLVHPKHEIMCEIAKWVLPIMCRDNRTVPTNFPTEMLFLKKEIAENYIFVLERVTPGIGKIRAKALFECLDVSMALTVKELQGGKMSQKALADRLRDIGRKCSDLISMLQVAGNLSPFEDWVLQRIVKMKEQCQLIL